MQEGQVVIFKWEERKEGKKKTYRWQTRPPPETRITLKGKGHGDTSNDKIEGHCWTLRGVTQAA
jgi:hypothetical protein